MLAVAVVAAALAVAPWSSPASHAGAAPEYLGLGDSIPYGFDPNIQGATKESQFIGYPTDLGAALGYTAVNASCPADSAAGFVSMQGEDLGCREKFRGYYNILHVDYEVTQQEFATEFLKSHPTTGLVTIQIGLNDLYACMVRTADNCASDVGAVMADYRTNLVTILQGLRAVYGGPLVLVNYHAQYYQHAITTFAPLHVNAVMAEVAPAFGAIVADTYGTFAAATANFGGDGCAAGLLYTYPGGCDSHLAPAGRALVAKTIAAALGRPY
ncbi:MAG: SGNH/GDSL hydrolase family protein [Sporichthyaceae bacterium]